MRRRFFSVDVLKNNASHFDDENALQETREEKHSIHYWLLCKNQWTALFAELILL